MITIKENVSLHPYSTFGIGGEALFFCQVRAKEELAEAFQFAKDQKIRPLIIGKGSNSLFDDLGFKGLVILNKIDFKEEIGGGLFRVGSGYSLPLLGTQTAKAGWSGLEFGAGIPGTVGGAVFMNAGALGQEIKDVLVAVEYMTLEGEIEHYSRSELTFSYRTSPFQTMDGAILSATFSLTPSQEAKEIQRDFLNYRTSTQPYGEKSIGCIFRNPEGASSGKLIEQAGLKGAKMGGAKVSTKHANFIINDNGAKAEEVLELISFIKQEVKKKTGYTLESEMRKIPKK